MRRILAMISMGIAMVASFLGCKTDPAYDNTITIAAWNVQNLFDSTDDGTEGSYTQFTSKGLWTDSAYRTRLDNVRKVFSLGELKNADVVILSEIENENVVSDIIDTREMAERGFSYFAFSKENGTPIGSAVISNIPIEKARTHSTGCRPVLEVRLKAEEGFITVLAVHAKSRLEGKEETDSIRKETAQTLCEIASSVLSDNPNEIVIIAGDLNDTYSDNVMMSSAWGDAPITVSSEPNGDNWYCFWMDSTLDIWPEGSYYWSEEDKWETFDNILIKNFSGPYKVKDAGVIFEGILKTEDQKPNSFVRNLLTGVSDHLPVWVSLV